MLTAEARRLESEPAPAPAPDLSRYQRMLGAFEATHGTITESIRYKLGSLALTLKPRSGIAERFLSPLAELHIAYHSTEIAPDVMELIDRAEELAQRATSFLRSRDRNLLLEEISGRVSHILGSVSLSVGGSVEPARIARHAQVLDWIQERYELAARRGAQLTYTTWMAIGLLPVTAIAALTAWLLVLGIPTFSVHTFVAVAVSGGVGAFVSVLARMSVGRFWLTPELGRGWIRVLAIVRPFVGAVFAVAVYFALVSKLLAATITGPPSRQFYAYAFLGFLAGFNERWASDMLIATEQATRSASPPAARLPETEPAQSPLQIPEE
jgi:hypothetical protein